MLVWVTSFSVYGTALGNASGRCRGTASYCAGEWKISLSSHKQLQWFIFCTPTKVFVINRMLSWFIDLLITWMKKITIRLKKRNQTSQVSLLLIIRMKYDNLLLLSGEYCLNHIVKLLGLTSLLYQFLFLQIRIFFKLLQKHV